MSNSTKILVVDNDQSIRINLFEMLSREQFHVMAAENVSTALEMIAENPPDLVLTDLKMADGSGLDLLRKIKVMNPSVPVILLTGHASVDTAVEAMRLGAEDYVLKPVHQDAVFYAVRQALQSRKVGQVAKAIRSVRQKSGMKKEKNIVGNSESLRRVMIRAKTVASSKATVLISGESGTGKEVFARYIHAESDRAAGPFVALNCAALPEGLLESELFGHEKGAFTGAVAAKKGKFELASGGTILLDEIGEVPLHLQAKLLRVLQEEEVDRLGGSEPTPVDVHVVASTNRNLEEMVAEGTFRQDLFYRLNVIPLVLPPLRERKTDIPILAHHFLVKFSESYGREIKEFSAPVQREFLKNKWLGNVREMENVIERAVLLSQSATYQLADFWDDLPEKTEDDDAMPAQVDWQTPPVQPADVHGPVNIHADDGSLVSLRDVERQMILHALHKTDNNRTHAAKMLGISVRTLRNKLHEYRSFGLLV